MYVTHIASLTRQVQTFPLFSSYDYGMYCVYTAQYSTWYRHIRTNGFKAYFDAKTINNGIKYEFEWNYCSSVAAKRWWQWWLYYNMNIGKWFEHIRMHVLCRCRGFCSKFTAFVCIYTDLIYLHFYFSIFFRISWLIMVVCFLIFHVLRLWLHEKHTNTGFFSDCVERLIESLESQSEKKWLAI